MTGGAGFIGQHLIRWLVKERANIVVVDDFSTGKMENIPSRCEILKCNVSNAGIFKRMPHIDYVFHFGAPSSVILFNRNPKTAFRDTIIGFINILEWAKDAGIKKIIYPSSGSVYGRNPLPHSEECNPAPNNLYGIAKLNCEHIASHYSEVVPSIGLRIFAGYGPGEDHKGEIASVITLFLDSMIRGKKPTIYGDGEQMRDFVYIDDVVKSIEKSAERSVEGVVNVGSGRAYTFNSVVSLINEFLDKDITPTYIPKPVSYLENTLAAIGKMKHLLGVNPMNLETGLSKYLGNL
ncbi:MAG TPA: NAD-dependent epimerase/dehydratase family protein [Candidatus Bathyarchaeia archaeon]|nr:NAD-dependent epimerase/dehydratase family protein [Candidatus Bathyarchaeia archaeon]